MTTKKEKDLSEPTVPKSSPVFVENERKVMSLFKYGYFDTVLSGRCGVPIDRVKELRVLYMLFKEKE